METQEYLLQRVDNQINWYNSNSKFNRYCYITTKVILTVIAAIIPALTAYMDNSTFVKITIGVLSVFTAILANVSGIFNFKDNWAQYRNMCELLLSEKFLYITGAGKYDKEDTKEKLFVDTIESYLQDENKKWAQKLNSVKNSEQK